MPNQTVQIPSVDGDLSAYLAAPASPDESRPGVLVLHEAFGLNDDMRRIARRFAENGYVALAPDLYSLGPRLKPICIRRAMGELQSGSGRTFDDIEAAHTWLAARDNVDDTRIAVAGFCMGGGFAILHAARSDVAAAADFYGAVPKDSHALDGICPVLGAYGARDGVFGAQAERLRGHLEELGVEHEVDVYPDAGHSFMSQYGPVLSIVVKFSPMNAGYHEPSAEAAWTTMLDFFERHLGGTPEPTET